MRTALVSVFVFILSCAACAENRPPAIDAQEFEEWFDELSNWGRWGRDDDLGTLNLVTHEVRRAAAREVSKGVSVSLARSVEKEEAADNPAPFGHTMIGAGTPDSENDGLMHTHGADRFDVAFHGFVHSHIDALCHIFHDGRLYNGASQARVTPDGAEVLSVLSMKDGILTRGVLIDLPAFLGLPYLPDDHVITVEQLDDWEKKTATSIRAGDAVLIRTGRWVKREEQGAWNPMTGASGVHPSVAFWFRERDAAVVGSDFAMDALPSLVEGSAFPFHVLAITAMGMPVLDALDLEALSRTAAHLDRRTFMLHVAPLAVAGATGSPINPIATF